jgi:DNA-binding transcriptional regulator YiaG
MRMPNIATVLKAEVTRLARKELRVQTDSLRKALGAYRSEVAALKRRVQKLEKDVARAGRAAKPVRKPAVEPSAESVASAFRFRAAGLASNRKRLGLSAADFGRLVGATGQSVYAWEAGKSKPKANNLAAIAALRGLGKREVAARLAALR